MRTQEWPSARESFSALLMAARTGLCKPIECLTRLSRSHWWTSARRFWWAGMEPSSAPRTAAKVGTVKKAGQPKISWLFRSSISAPGRRLAITGLFCIPRSSNKPRAIRTVVEQLFCCPNDRLIAAAEYLASHRHSGRRRYFRVEYLDEIRRRARRRPARQASAGISGQPPFPALQGVEMTPTCAVNSLAVNWLSFHCSIRFTQASRRSCLMPQTNTRLVGARQPHDPPNAYAYSC